VKFQRVAILFSNEFKKIRGLHRHFLVRFKCSPTHKYDQELAAQYMVYFILKNPDLFSTLLFFSEGFISLHVVHA